MLAVSRRQRDAWLERRGASPQQRANAPRQACGYIRLVICAAYALNKITAPYIPDALRFVASIAVSGHIDTPIRQAVHCIT